MLPDIASLRLLADVARLGSIGAAGRAAGISQQSASERLRAMEAQTRLVLVQRAHRGSALTDAGKLLVEWSSDLLARADEIEVAFDTLRLGRSEELHIHASQTAAEYLLPRWLVELRRMREVAVSLRAANSEEVVQAVRSGDADLGFVEGPVDVSGLATTVVGTDELVLVASPDDVWGRRRSPVTPARLAARPLTAREPGSGTRAVVFRALEAVGETAAVPDVELDTNKRSSRRYVRVEPRHSCPSVLPRPTCDTDRSSWWRSRAWNWSVSSEQSGSAVPAHRRDRCAISSVSPAPVRSVDRDAAAGTATGCHLSMAPGAELSAHGRSEDRRRGSGRSGSRPAADRAIRPAA